MEPGGGRDEGRDAPQHGPEVRQRAVAVGAWGGAELAHAAGPVRGGLADDGGDARRRPHPGGQGPLRAPPGPAPRALPGRAPADVPAAGQALASDPGTGEGDFFPQAHRPGEALQTDFTHAKVLGITIQGQPFPHLLCVSVLPYSNWRWATPCRSESILALSEGVQNAVFELGHVPQYHQTDHSTAATHLVDSAWVFNDEYEALMRHLGMSPRTTEVGRKEQNGSIEAMNGALKRHLEQELLLRGSRDFESLAAYEAWLQAVLRKGNRGRSTRLAEELAVMRPLGVRRLPDYKVVDVRVGSGSTIRAKSCTYSVPARLIGERVRVHVHETRVKVYLGGQHQVTLERVRGRGAHNVNWRHVIGWMVKKPGAFRRYRYRDPAPGVSSAGCPSGRSLRPLGGHL